MAFFQKLMNYLIHEVVVQGLANSRAFQRFAVRTDAMLSEMKTKGEWAQEVRGAMARRQSHG